MPWRDVTLMDLRRDFVTAADRGTMPFVTLCARFGISRKTGYKWLARYRTEGMAGLVDQSRRPHTSPGLTDPDMTTMIRIVATAHPTWGGRLIRHALVNQGLTEVPAASTITAILGREGLRPRDMPAPHPVIRFEADAPNHRWQMDFKGWTATRTGRLTPLTVLDESSRYLLLLEHVPDGTFLTVQALLTDCFHRYGLPWQLLADNGPPWGSSHARILTRMDVWLLRLGIRPLHGRPLHPQTQGKVERFHRTLHIDLLHQPFDSPQQAQVALDAYRLVYNHERPHSALGFRPPADHYTLSVRTFPGTLGAIEYDDEAQIRQVSAKGTIRYQNRVLFLSEALHGLPVGVYPTLRDGVMRIQFCSRTLTTIDLRTLDPN
jgi:transposase InsO family protein